MAQFEKLWEADDTLRLAAIADFVAGLEPATSTPTTSSTSLDDLHPDVLYALKRLVRGLASPRDAARIGFSVALTELLAHLPDCPVSPILELILTHTEVTGSTKGDEARDRNFGRLVGLEAIIASRILFSPLRSSIRNLQTICNALLALFDAKSYLKESAGKAVCDLIAYLPAGDAWIKAARNAILASSRAETPEYIAWALAFPGTPSDGPLSTSGLSSTAKALKVRRSGGRGPAWSQCLSLPQSTHSVNSVSGEPHAVWGAIAETRPSADIIASLIGPLLIRDATPTQRREGLLALASLISSPSDLSHIAFQLAIESSAKGRSAAPGMSIAAKKLVRSARSFPRSLLTRRTAHPRRRPHQGRPRRRVRPYDPARRRRRGRLLCRAQPE
jgi:hypothetical protein